MNAQNQKGIEKNKIDSKVTQDGSLLFEQQERKEIKSMIIKILPLIFVKINVFFSTATYIVQGILIWKNGLPIQLVNITNQQKMLILLNKNCSKNLIDFCSQSHTIKIKKEYKVISQEENPESFVIENTIFELKKCQNEIQKFLQIQGTIRGFSTISKKIKYFLVKDKIKIKQIIEKHKISGEMVNECCKKEIDNETIEKGEPRKCIKRLKQLQLSKMTEEKCITGGTCIVKQQKAEIKYFQNNELKTDYVNIAIKKLKSEYEKDEKKLQKIIYEKKIINFLENQKYILKYYELQRGQNYQIYMEYVQKTLRTRIRQSSLGLKDKVKIGKQITQSILLLHDDGIVHRDLKPHNILVSKDNSIKIIDFAESIKIGTVAIPDSPTFLKLCSTVPYSPLECLRICPEGYSKSKIDNWSIGVIIAEMIFGKLPFCFSKMYEKEIVKGWTLQNQFLYGMSCLKNSGLKSINNYMKIISMMLLRFQNKQRLCLEGVLEIFQLIENRIEDFFLL